MKTTWVLVTCMLLPSCGAARTPNCPGLAPAQGPFAIELPSDTARQPPVWLEPERDVLVNGQTPVVWVRAESGGGVYRDTAEFDLRAVGNARLDRTCDNARRPHGSRGFASLNFECQHPVSEGLYTVGLVPSRVGLSGVRVEATFRVVSQVPFTPPPPSGWVRAPIAAGIPDNCYNFYDEYEVSLQSGRARISAAKRKPPAPIPRPLASRMSSDHARGVNYVFEDDEGWLVLFDHGEFGGGIEWYATAGGSPRAIVIGASDNELAPENVNRAMTAGGRLFVLQGLTHANHSSGRLAVTWREHDHFSSHVIATFHSEPVDWLVLPEGGWLIATWDAVWKVTAAGEVSLTARLPDILEYPSSLVRTSDGTIYVGGRRGVLRLTSVWNEDPRYAADLLIPEASAQEQCWKEWSSSQAQIGKSD